MKLRYWLLSLFLLSPIAALAQLASLDVSIGGTGTAPTQTFASFQFLPVTLSDINTQVGGGWNATTNTYTVPSSGVYQITTKLRLADNTASTSFAVGASTTLGDGTFMVWNQFTGTRTTLTNTRIANLTAGQAYQMVTYCGGANLCALDSADLQINQLCTLSNCAGSGGAPTFTSVTSGTNVQAAMLVGTGASLGVTGTGTISATAVPLTGITGFATGAATFLATPTSANLAALVSNETGTGSLVFGTGPTLTLTNATGLPLAAVVAGASASGLYDFSPATQIKLPSAAGYTAAASGEIGYDTTNGNIHFNASSTDLIALGLPSATPPTNGQCAIFTKIANWWELTGQACSTGAGTVTTFSSTATIGTLFTTSVATATTTPSQTITLANAPAYSVWGNFTGAAAIPGYSNSPTFQSLTLLGNGTTGGGASYGTGVAPTGGQIGAGLIAVWADSSTNWYAMNPNNVGTVYFLAAASAFTSGQCLQATGSFTAATTGSACGTGGTSGISGATSGQALIAGSATTATSSKPLSGSGAGLVTGPTSSVSGDLLSYTGTAGQTLDSGILGTAVVTLTGTQTITGKSIVATQINSGTLPAAVLPLATTAAFGAVKCDGTTITCTSGVITSTGGGGGTSTNFNIPRDANAHYEVASPYNTAFTLVSAYAANSGGTFTAVLFPDAAGYLSMQGTTSATIDTQVGQVLSQSVLPINNPTFQAIFHLSTAANVNAWVALCSYCDTDNSSGLDPGTSGAALVGFRHFSATEATNWTCYASDTTSSAAGTTMDTGVAVNTTQMQKFDVIYVANAPQFYINNTRVCSSFVAAHLPGATIAMGANVVWENTTAAAVTGNIFDLYFGAN